LGTVYYKEVGEEKVTNSHLKNVAKNLDLNLNTLKKYYEKAKEEGFITKSDTIAKRYLKQIEKEVKKNEEKEKNKKIENIINTIKAEKTKISEEDREELKKFITPKTTGGIFDKMFNLVLKNMINSIYDDKKKPILLSGGPGIGKTSFVKQLAKLLGLPLFIVDTPLITKYTYISSNNIIIDDSEFFYIPYTIYPKEKKLEKELTSPEMTKEDLFSKLKKAKNFKLNEEEHLKQIKEDKNLHEIAIKYANLIVEIREAYDAILFFDDYSKTDNINIKKFLKEISNRRIGNDKIPNNIYILFAS
jgi:DNA-binding transcriptional regulator YhcF (GntR family)